LQLVDFSFNALFFAAADAAFASPSAAPSSSIAPKASKRCEVFFFARPSEEAAVAIIAGLVVMEVI